MKTKKPDIFLGITMGMLVLAAVLCIVILIVQKSDSGKPAKPDANVTTEALNSNETADPNTQTTGETAATQTPAPGGDVATIDENGLKAALDDALSGLSSEWQVMVIDPLKGSQISSAVNCGVDDWMTANQMTQVFLMGTVYQQISEGVLTEDQVLEDVKSMLSGDTEAADKLTELVGGGDAAKGRETVKTFATDNGVKLGFNRPLTGSSSQKNYVTAQQTAQVLDLLVRGELVSKESSAKMLELLMAAGSPQIETGLTDASKGGFINDVEEGVCICTMGVVQTGSRSFVISVVCNEPVTTNGAKNKITEIIKLTEGYFTK